MVVKGSCHARVHGHYVTLRGRSRYGRGRGGTSPGLSLGLGLAVPIAGEGRGKQGLINLANPCLWLIR
jgi:hypothetical protein